MTNTEHEDSLGLARVIVCVLLVYALLAIGCLIPTTAANDREIHKQIMVDKMKAFAEERE